MTAYNHRDVFTPTQILHTVLTILILANATFVGGLAVDYANPLGLVLLAMLGLGAVISALSLINGKTGRALRLTLIPITLAVLIIIFTQGSQFAIAKDFIWQNIVLAWQSFTNRT